MKTAEIQGIPPLDRLGMFRPISAVPHMSLSITRLKSLKPKAGQFTDKAKRCQPAFCDEVPLSLQFVFESIAHDVLAKVVAGDCLLGKESAHHPQLKQSTSREKH